MNRAIAILGSIGAGVAAAYFLDPKKGADRRSQLRDKFNSLKEDAGRAISDATDKFRHSGNGVSSEPRAMIGGGRNASAQKQQAVH